MIQAMCDLLSAALQQSFWKKQTLFPDVFRHIFMTDSNRTLSDINLGFHWAWDWWSGLCEWPLPLTTSLALLWTWVDCLQRLSRTLSWEQHSTGAGWQLMEPCSHPPPPYSSRTNHGRGRCSFPSWGRAGESKRPRRSGQPATPIKALFFLCKPSYIYL